MKSELPETPVGVRELEDCLAEWDFHDIFDELGLWDASSDWEEARSWLRRRQLAKAKPYLDAALATWEEAAERLKSETRDIAWQSLAWHLTEHSLEIEKVARETIEGRIELEIDSLAEHPVFSRLEQLRELRAGRIGASRIVWCNFWRVARI